MMLVSSRIVYTWFLGWLRVSTQPTRVRVSARRARTLGAESRGAGGGQGLTARRMVGLVAWAALPRIRMGHEVVQRPAAHMVNALPRPSGPFPGHDRTVLRYEPRQQGEQGARRGAAFPDLLADMPFPVHLSPVTLLRGIRELACWRSALHTPRVQQLLHEDEVVLALGWPPQCARQVPSLSPTRARACHGYASSALLLRRNSGCAWT